jgi:hypothetical protein
MDWSMSDIDPEVVLLQSVIATLKAGLNAIARTTPIPGQSMAPASRSRNAAFEARQRWCRQQQHASDEKAGERVVRHWQLVR